MPSADFSAARERLASRARARAVAIDASGRSRKVSRSTSLTRLPLPLRSLGAFGLALWDNVKGREGTQPAFRVGQVDAELLDEELLELLKGQVGDGLKFFGVSAPSSSSCACFCSSTDKSAVASSRRPFRRNPSSSPRDSIQTYHLGP
jgi:hypothetical protein